MTRHKFRLNAILISFLLMLMMIGCSNKQQSTNQQQDASQQQTEAQSPTADQQQTEAQQQTDVLQIQVLKVGKADAIVLQCGSETMVIDCGEEEDGQEVLDYLKSNGVQKIDTLIITHFDKDHVGGADTVVSGIPVDRLLLPAYISTGKQYKAFVAAYEAVGIEPENVTETLSFDFGGEGGASVTVEPPASYEIPNTDDEYDNDFSLITTIDFNGKKFVFAGDIEEARIHEWLSSGTVGHCDVLKVPHHGVYNDALAELFESLQPKYAIICDSKKNPADTRTLELLKKVGAECLQTMNGDIGIRCIGQNIELLNLRDNTGSEPGESRSNDSDQSPKAAGDAAAASQTAGNSKDSSQADAAKYEGTNNKESSQLTPAQNVDDTDSNVGNNSQSSNTSGNNASNNSPGNDTSNNNASNNGSGSDTSNNDAPNNTGSDNNDSVNSDTSDSPNTFNYGIVDEDED